MLLVGFEPMTSTVLLHIRVLYHRATTAAQESTIAHCHSSFNYKWPSMGQDEVKHELQQFLLTSLIHP